MKKFSDRRLSLIYAFLVYSIFGFSFLFSKVALRSATPMVLLAIRFTVAFIILNILILTHKCTLSLKGKNIRTLLLLGIISPVIYFICENYGVNLSSISMVGIILALIPVGSIIFGFVLLGERITIIQAVCVFISVLGVFLTTMGQESGSFSWMGFILLISAVCAAASSTVLSRKISGEFTAFERTYVMFALGCAVFIIIALFQCRGNMREMILVPLTTPSFLISVIFLAVLSSVCAFFMLNYAMGHLSAAQASIFANVSTIISILAGVIVLKESFGAYQVIGSLIIIISVYVMNKPKNSTLKTP